MVTIGSARRAAETRHRRVLPNGFSFHRSEWMDTGKGPGLSPTVFLVEQPPGTELSPHFHTNNQFQVVKDGGGTLGPHRIGPGSVHYAGAYTGYGPLRAGPEGLSYFTIRAVHETGANFLPAGREKLRRGPKQHAQGPVHRPASLEELRGLLAPRRTPLIARQGELEAFAVYLPPRAELPPSQPRGNGQFQLLFAGELETPEGCLLPWESRFLSADEEQHSCYGGAAGAHVLVLHMPATAREYAIA